MVVLYQVSLKAARVNANLTQKKSARELGVDVSTLQNWEHGKTFPDADQIEKICRLYAVPYDCINFLPDSPLLADN